MSEPTREEVDAMMGPVVLEFGANWCPHCQGIQRTMERLRGEYGAIRHIGVEDGKGKPLGRSFRVKLWPTLVFLRDGAVVKELVRPDEAEMEAAFAELANG